MYILYDEREREAQNFDQLLEDVWGDLYDRGVSMHVDASARNSNPRRAPPLAYHNVNSAYCSELIGLNSLSCL